MEDEGALWPHRILLVLVNMHNAFSIGLPKTVCILLYEWLKIQILGTLRSIDIWWKQSNSRKMCFQDDLFLESFLGYNPRHTHILSFFLEK